MVPPTTTTTTPEAQQQQDHVDIGDAVQIPQSPRPGGPAAR